MLFFFQIAFQIIQSAIRQINTFLIPLRTIIAHDHRSYAEVNSENSTTEDPALKALDISRHAFHYLNIIYSKYHIPFESDILSTPTKASAMKSLSVSIGCKLEYGSQ